MDGPLRTRQPDGGTPKMVAVTPSKEVIFKRTSSASKASSDDAPTPVMNRRPRGSDENRPPSTAKSSRIPGPTPRMRRADDGIGRMDNITSMADFDGFFARESVVLLAESTPWNNRLRSLQKLHKVFERRR
eukprot:tig00021348_g20506.t1